MEKAKEIVDKLGVSDSFIASNGWLDHWKTRHNVRRMTVSGESGYISGLTAQSWKERIPHIVEGYIHVVVNMCRILTKWDVFGRHYRIKGLARKLNNVKVGKSASKE